MGSHSAVVGSGQLLTGGLSGGGDFVPAATTTLWSMTSAGSILSSSTRLSSGVATASGGGKPGGEVDGGVPTVYAVLVWSALLVSLAGLGVVLWRCAGRRYAHRL
jgi:hypothetical protein